MTQGRILNLVVRAYSGGAPSVFMGLSYALSSVASAGRNAAVTLTAVGAAMLGAGALILAGVKNSVTAAIQYEALMTRIKTLTETTPAGFAMMKDAVLELTRTIPKSAEEMAEALYFIKSVVEDDADAMVLLEVSAKAASLAMSDVEPIAKTLSSAMIAYGVSVEQTTLFADQLTQAVSVGRAEYQDFATQMGSIIGYGTTLGVTFSELSTWMAFMTRRGYSSSQSAVLLRNVMMKVIKPAAQAKDKFKELGIAWGQDAVKAAGGLIPYLQRVGEAVNWNADELAKLFPGLRQLPLLLNMAQDAARGSAGELATLQKSIENSAGTVEERFSLALETAHSQLSLLKNAFHEVAIRLGTEFLPVLGAAIQPIRDFVQSIAVFIQENPKIARTFMLVATAIGVALTVMGGIAIMVGLLELLWGAMAPVIGFVTLLGIALVPLTSFLMKLNAEVSENTNTFRYLGAAWDNLMVTLKILWNMFAIVFRDLTGGKAQIRDAAEATERFAEWIANLTNRFREWAESDKAAKFMIGFRDGIRAVWEVGSKVVAFIWEWKGAIAVLGAVALMVFKTSIFGSILGLLSPLGKISGKSSSITGIWARLAKLNPFKAIGTGLLAIQPFLTKHLWYAGTSAGKWRIFKRVVATSMAGAKASVMGFLRGGIGKIASVMTNLPMLFKGIFFEGAMYIGVAKTAVLNFIGKIGALPGLLMNSWKAFGGIQGILGKLVTGFGGLATKLGALMSGGFMTSLWTGFVSVLSTVASVLLPIIAVVLILAGIAYTLWKYWDQVTKVFSSTSPFIQNLIATFQPLIEQIRGQLKPLWESLVQLFNALKPVLVAIGAVIGAVLVVALGLLVGIIAGVVGALAGLIQFVRGVIQVITGIVNVIVGALQFAWGFVTGNQAMMDAAKETLLNGVGQIKDGIINVFSGLWNAVAGFLSGFWSGVVGFFTGLYDTLVGHSIIPDMVNGIINWIGRLPGLAFAIVSDLARGFVTRVRGLASDVASGFKTLVSNSMRFLGSLPGEVASLIASAVRSARDKVSEFVDVGRAIADGIKDGVRNTWDSLVSKLKGLVALLPAAVKKILGIASPSKVFAALGWQLPNGLAVGIENAIPIATRAVDKMSAALNPGLSVGYGMQTTTVIRHEVSFGNLPEGLKLDMTGREVADLLNSDPTAIKDVSRKVSYHQKREVR